MEKRNKKYGLLSYLLVAMLLFSCSKKDSRPNETHSFEAAWEFKQETKDEWLPARIPGNVLEDLLEQNLIEDAYFRDEMSDQAWVAKEDWVYKTRFDVNEAWLERSHIELSFDGLDIYADVSLNGENIILANNAFLEWNSEVKDILKKKDNELIVFFHSPEKQNEELSYFDNGANSELQMYNRKPAYQYNSPYGPEWIGQGITAPVSFQLWDDMRMKHVYLKQMALSKERANIQAQFSIESDGSHSAELKISDASGNVLATKDITVEKGIQELRVDFLIDNPKLWWTHDLGDPHLYEIKCELIQGTVVQERTEKIGLRNIAFQQDDKGTHINLNGVPIAAKGTNAMPLELMPTRLSEKAYKVMIQDVRKANMNIIRMNGIGRYEEDIMYDLCDENGILIWQDFMFAGKNYPLESESFENTIQKEATAQLIRLRNHPSIAVWNGNASEATKEHAFFNEMLPGLVRKHSDVAYIPSATGVNVSSESSYPSMTMIETFTEFDDRYVGSYVMSAHLSQATDDSLMYQKVHEEFQAPYDFPQYIYLSQLAQAREVGRKIKQSRVKERRQVLLTDQLNDFWPGISRSSIDYFGNWKALQYKLKEVYAPLMISCEETDGQLKIAAVNDTPEVMNGQLRLQIKNFEGQLLKTAQKAVQLEDFSSQECAALNRKEWLEGIDKQKAVLQIELLDENGKQLAAHLHYFVKTKALELTYPQIPYKVDKEGDHFVLEMFTNTLVKDLRIVSDYDGFFEKNYFDLLPNDTLRIRFFNQYELDGFDPNAIQFNSIADSFILEY